MCICVYCLCIETEPHCGTLNLISPFSLSVSVFLCWDFQPAHGWYQYSLPCKQWCVEEGLPSLDVFCSTGISLFFLIRCGKKQTLVMVQTLTRNEAVLSFICGFFSFFMETMARSQLLWKGGPVLSSSDGVIFLDPNSLKAFFCSQEW